MPCILKHWFLPDDFIGLSDQLERWIQSAFLYGEDIVATFLCKLFLLADVARHPALRVERADTYGIPWCQLLTKSGRGRSSYALLRYHSRVHPGFASLPLSQRLVWVEVGASASLLQLVGCAWPLLPDLLIYIFWLVYQFC